MTTKYHEVNFNGYQFIIISDEKGVRLAHAESLKLGDYKEVSRYICILEIVRDNMCTIADQVSIDRIQAERESE